MNENRLADYLDHMQQAAMDACAFVEGLTQEDFRDDKRTQQAVIMSLIILGEAATKVMDGYPDFVQAQTQVPWRNMRGMRNRIAHGDFDINLDVVWDTVQTALPELLKLLPAVRQQADKARLFSRNVWMDYPWIAKASTDAGCGAAPGVQSSMRNQPRYDARYLVATPLKRRIQPRKRLT